MRILGKIVRFILIIIGAIQIIADLAMVGGATEKAPHLARIIGWGVAIAVLLWLESRSNKKHKAKTEI